MLHESECKSGHIFCCSRSSFCVVLFMCGARPNCIGAKQRRRRKKNGRPRIVAFVPHVCQKNAVDCTFSQSRGRTYCVSWQRTSPHFHDSSALRVSETTIRSFRRSAVVRLLYAKWWESSFSFENSMGKSYETDDEPLFVHTRRALRLQRALESSAPIYMAMDRLLVVSVCILHSAREHVSVESLRIHNSNDFSS